ncbi:hypothetical protein OG604_38315 [Streptomyces sp. NBC_01231]|nr:hypothetical protein OG604_38315 [Streptomyces sp. NBC_01231]
MSSNAESPPTTSAAGLRRALLDGPAPAADSAPNDLHHLYADDLVEPTLGAWEQ